VVQVVVQVVQVVAPAAVAGAFLDGATLFMVAPVMAQTLLNRRGSGRKFGKESWICSVIYISNAQGAQVNWALFAAHVKLMA